MKRNISNLIVALTILLSNSALSQQIECRPVEGIDIFYVNGMRTEDWEAEFAVQQIERLFPDHNVENAYVTTHGTVRDTAEAVAQKRLMDSYPELTDRSQSEILSSVMSWILHGNELEDPVLDDYFNAVFIEVYLENLEAISNIAQQEDFSNHIRLYRTSLENGRNIVLIGFSQGTLYTNFAYYYLRNLNPDWARRIGVVDAGSVAEGHFVFDGLMAQGNGRYMTFNNDEVVNRVRARFPETLPGNFQRQRDIGTNHQFWHYFGTDDPELVPLVDMNEVRQQIANFNAVVDELDVQVCEEIPEPEPAPIPCGGTIHAGGGTNGYHAIMELGSTPGRVRGIFESFYIPDRLDIRHRNGNTLFTTNNFVRGTSEIAFYHEGSLTNTEVIIDVTGNSDIGTEWVLSIGCPDGATRDPDHSHLPELAVKVEHDVDPSDPEGQCVTKVWLNGNEVLNVKSTTPETITEYFPLGYGTHQLQADYGCDCDRKFGCGSTIGSATYAVSGTLQKGTLPSCFFGCKTVNINVSPPGGNSSLSKLNVNNAYENLNDLKGAIYNVKAYLPGDTPSSQTIVDLQLAQVDGVVLYNNNFDRHGNARPLSWQHSAGATTQIQFKVVNGPGPRTRNNPNYDWTNFSYTATDPCCNSSFTSTHLKVLPGQFYNDFYSNRVKLPYSSYFKPTLDDYILIHYRMRTVAGSNVSPWYYIKPIYLYYPD